MSSRPGRTKPVNTESRLSRLIPTTLTNHHQIRDPAHGLGPKRRCSSHA